MISSRREVVFAGLACAAAPMPALAQPRTAAALIAASRAQVGVTLAYDPAYSRLAFPGGDVDRARGVCTDVIVRAYRDAFGLDLQALVNADMRANFAAYPKRWGLSRPDTNIDHRRVPNLQTYFQRAGAQLAMPTAPTAWQPGDIVTSLIDNRLPHIGIVADRVAGTLPLVVHNIGAGTREEDVLAAHAVTGRYRWGLTD